MERGSPPRRRGRPARRRSPRCGTACRRQRRRGRRPSARCPREIARRKLDLDSVGRPRARRRRRRHRRWRARREERHLDDGGPFDERVGEAGAVARNVCVSTYSAGTLTLATRCAQPATRHQPSAARPPPAAPAERRRRRRRPPPPPGSVLCARSPTPSRRDRAPTTVHGAAARPHCRPHPGAAGAPRAASACSKSASTARSAVKRTRISPVGSNRSPWMTIESPPPTRTRTRETPTTRTAGAVSSAHPPIVRRGVGAARGSTTSPCGSGGGGTSTTPP